MGGPPYSGMLHRMLAESPPSPAPWGAYNLGVFGYSVVQGHKVFKQFASVYEPDVVTIYFGWNDHWWSGQGRPDSSTMAVATGSARAYLISRLQERRLGQMLAGAFLLPRGTTHRATDEADCRRVPEAEYTRVLQELVADIRRLGATPILITAPRGESLAEELVSRGNVTSIEAGLAIHDHYVELTRAVARKLGAPIIDLAGPESPMIPKMFKEDGIHLRHEGNCAVARAIHAKIVEISRKNAVGQVQ
jgi:lysophospholipase L1-like esterase